MSNDPFSNVWKLNRVSVFTEAMQLANARQSDDGRAGFVAQPKRPGNGLPIVEAPVHLEPSSGLAIRIAAMIVGVIALSTFAAFGLAA